MSLVEGLQSGRHLHNLATFQKYKIIVFDQKSIISATFVAVTYPTRSSSNIISSLSPEYIKGDYCDIILKML
jgi:hypothetical protein